MTYSADSSKNNQVKKNWDTSNFLDVRPAEIASIIKETKLGVIVGTVNAIIITFCIWPNGNPIFMGAWLTVSVCLFSYIGYRALRVKERQITRVSQKAVIRLCCFSLLFALPCDQPPIFIPVFT